ncbi:ABC transporter substrate-binding protein [Deltaproteobacteria bacterium TL4]
MKFRQRWLLVCLGIGMVLGGILLGVQIGMKAKEPSLPKYSVPLEEITVGLSGDSELSGLIWIADSQGFLKENGIRVNYQSYGSGVRAITSLIQGKIELVVASDIAMVNQSFEHPQLKVMVSIARTEDNNAIIARRDRGIEQSADLRGKKIGITKNSTLNNLLNITPE